MAICLSHWHRTLRNTTISGLVGVSTALLLEYGCCNRVAQAEVTLPGTTLSIVSEAGLEPPIRVSQVPFPVQPPRPLPTPTPLPTLPPSDELLKPTQPATPPEITPGEGAVTIVVTQFKVVGSTVFTEQELAKVLAPFTNRPLTLVELLQARTAVTELYTKAGYVTSGAYIPPQDPQSGVVTIQVLEGRVESIKVTGNQRLRPSYITRRLELATQPPLNVNQLVEKLRLLQLNPLINNITAELSSGVQPGTSILNVAITEADSFQLDLFTNNARSPAVGSWERGLELRQANLLGFGDELTIGYINTSGSNEVSANYTIPINPRNGTIGVNYRFIASRVVEDPFEVLDIRSNNQNYEISYRQPLFQTPTQEFALSLTASHQRVRSEYLKDLLGEAIPFPAFGSDDNGQIQVSALRFAQEWTKQGSRDVLALRSQFNVGVDLLDPTISNTGPDSRFFSWLGQAQYVRLLAPDTLLLLRAEAQFTGDALLPLEQYGLGGQRTVRGYRQDLLLTDNAVLASAELRLPLYRDRRLNGVLQGIAFVDFGTGWNVSLPDPDPSTLVSIGLGLLWRMGDRFSARIDWGIPLVSPNADKNTLQEKGLYFSVRYTAF